MTKLYLASALARCVHTCMVASGLAREFSIVSTWHRRAKPKDKDPRDDEERAAILSSNLVEIERADVIVALVDDGEPHCTYGEIGYALAVGKPVVWVHESATGRNLLDAHASVVRLDLRESELTALPGAIRIAAGMARDRLSTLPAPPLDAMSDAEFHDAIATEGE
jgi:nucleoside 2-deoxyribosyltransferase